jgi:hypothetical protein
MAGTSELRYSAFDTVRPTCRKAALGDSNFDCDSDTDTDLDTDPAPHTQRLNRPLT